MVYVRISQDREGAGLGVERQESDCRALAERLGWVVSEVYVDNDVSAYSGKRRPSYERLLERVESGATGGVLAWHPDRLHRSPRELEHYIDVSERHGFTTHTVQAGEWDLSTPSGRATARTLGAWARYESEHKSERIRAARYQQARRGVWHGGVRPFGFEADGVTIRPTEAAEVRSAVEQIVAGVSLRSLVRDLNRRGVPTARSAPAWSSMALRDMILSPRVAGFSTHLGEIVAKAQWEPLVPESVWRAAVAILNDPTRRTSPGGTVRWLGSGLYVCGTCGRPRLRASTSGGKRQPAYRCAAREVGETTGHVVRDCRLLDAYVEQVIVGRLSSDDFRRSLAQTERRRDTTDLNVEATAVRERLTELAELFAGGKVTAAQLATATATLTARLDELGAGLARAGASDPLADLVGGADVHALWFGSEPGRGDGLSLGKRRAVLDALMTVTVMPTGRGRKADGSMFDPSSIRVEWKG